MAIAAYMRSLLWYVVISIILTGVLFSSTTFAMEVPLYIVVIENDAEGMHKLRGIYRRSLVSAAKAIEITCAQESGLKAWDLLESFSPKAKIPYSLDLVRCDEIETTAYCSEVLVQVMEVVIKQSKIPFELKDMEEVGSDKGFYFPGGIFKYNEGQGGGVTKSVYLNPVLIVKEETSCLILPACRLNYEKPSDQLCSCTKAGKKVSRKDFHILELDAKARAFVDLPGRCLVYQTVNHIQAGKRPVMSFGLDKDGCTLLYSRPYKVSGDCYSDKLFLSKIDKGRESALANMVRPVFDLRLENGDQEPLLFDVHWLGESYSQKYKISSLKIQKKSNDIYEDVGGSARLDIKTDKTTRQLQHRWVIGFLPNTKYDPTDNYRLRFDGGSEKWCSLPFSFHSGETTKVARAWHDTEVVVIQKPKASISSEPVDDMLFADEVPTANTDLQKTIPVSMRGKYIIKSADIVGTGKQSDVYLCVDSVSRQRCAVRIDRDSPRPMSSVDQELSVLKLLCGKKVPGVIEIYAAEKLPGTNKLVVVMSECAQNLRAAAKADSSWRTPARVKWAIKQVVAGLSQLHQLDIGHHDIKPENILVTHSGNLKIADFGEAEILDEDGISKTVAGCQAVFGPTLDMFLGKDVGELLLTLERGGYQVYASDIVSLFPLIFNLRSGTVPIASRNTAFLNKIGHDSAPSCRPNLLTLQKQIYFFRWINGQETGTRPESTRKNRVEELYSIFSISADRSEMEFIQYVLGLTSSVCNKNYLARMLIETEYLK